MTDFENVMYSLICIIINWYDIFLKQVDTYQSITYNSYVLAKRSFELKWEIFDLKANFEMSA